MRQIADVKIFHGVFDPFRPGADGFVVRLLGAQRPGTGQQKHRYADKQRNLYRFEGATILLLCLHIGLRPFCM